jgi:surface polysaccharide O-acyltransferase-like enzyme
LDFGLREDYTVSQAPTVSSKTSDQNANTVQSRAMNEPAAQKEFLLWPDLIRVVAIFLVVTVHVSGQITNVWGKVPESDWFVANIYGGIARICVPLFFMISGYLLLPRSESLGTFYRKRMPKVIIPFLAWSLIYLGWYCGNHPGMCTAPLIRNLLFVQGTYYHLWFMYSLIGIYLILPILRLLVRPEIDRKILWYFIGLWLIFQSALNFARYFWDFKISISAPLVNGFVGFFILGYLLGSWKLSRSMVILVAVVWVLSTLGTILGTYYLTRASGKFENYFYGFTTPNVLLASATSFLLVKWLSETRSFTWPKIQYWIRTLAAASFGIYLVHVLVIELLQYWIPGYHIDTFMGNPLWSVPLVTTVVFILSYWIVRLLQRVPVLNRIVP